MFTTEVLTFLWAGFDTDGRKIAVFSDPLTCVPSTIQDKATPMILKPYII